MKNTKDFSDGDNNIAIVLDVSQSMNVRDMEGKSRLQTAKKKIYTILSKYEGYNFSLTIFAWDSQRVLPFTDDISLFATFLQWLDSTNITRQGTNVQAAMEDGVKSFWEDKTGFLIIFTDGDENYINLDADIIKKIKKQDIQSFIVWVGTKKGGYIPTGDVFSPYKTYRWQRVIARLNTKALKDISSQIGGKYLSINDDIKLDIQGKIKNTSSTASNMIYLYILLWCMFLGISIYEIYRK